FIPAQEPYRRTIGVVWKANASLVQAITQGWDGKSVRRSTRELYLEEREVRKAMDSSLHFYGTMAHQASKKDREEYQLAHFRKATALIAAQTIAIGGELEGVKIREVEPQLRIRLVAA